MSRIVGHGSAPYTDRNELSTITAPDGSVWSYEYNGLGQPVSVWVNAPNGIRTVYTYDTRDACR